MGLGAAALGAAALAARANSSGGGSSNRQGRRRGGQRGSGNRNRYGREAGDEDVDQMDFIFKAIAEVDVTDCAKKYLCEISAAPLDTLSVQDINTLGLFQAPNSSATSYKRLFDEAAILGSSSRDIHMCNTRYTACDIQGP